ncbi:hypothetical protein [Kribbella ginsengisoli]|uniref:Uncharacterized protein n=1 Tax=Kribbella ginsengisoli TaxID=363865 RepID=A0ABP6YBU6_9ACTN
MTTEDPTETLLTESLDRHAAEAPDDHNLLTTVHTRLRRRRTGRTIGAAVLAAAVVATTITATQSLNHDAGPAGNTDGGSAAKGFRWESYKTVQVQVPASWTHYASSPAPCGSATAPTIGRLAPWVTPKWSGCAVAVMPLKERHEYVWFDDVQKPGIKKYDAGWTEETREVGGVRVSVLTQNDALRQRILDSAAPLINAPDGYGCEQNGYLPQEDDSTESLVLGKITSVDICDYWGIYRGKQSSLIAGSSLEGKQATSLAQQITRELQTAPKIRVPSTLLCLPQGLKTVRLTLHGPDGNWSMLFQEQNCTNQYYTRVGSDSRVFSIAFTDLLFTGVHNPEQPTNVIQIPAGSTPPAR